MERRGPEARPTPADAPQPNADTNTRSVSSRGLPVALVGIAAAILVLFVYGYPRLFPLIEAAHSSHYEKNVADALTAGNAGRALAIARHAVEMMPLDPMAYTVYGRALLHRGKTEEALEQLEKALTVPRRESDPRDMTRREAYYFAPARLTLGAHYWEQGRLRDAVVNFELAQAYAVPAGPEYGAFQPALYEAYARQELWGRALEFGTPSDRELDALDDADVLRIARICEGKQDWGFAGRLTERLSTNEGSAAEAEYLLGRVILARGQSGAALPHLEEAASSGIAHAAFYVGIALEKDGQQARAIQAYSRVPSGDLYRPFALARALELLEDSPEDERSLAAATRQDILKNLDDEIAGMRLLERPLRYDTYRRFKPVAVKISETYFASGGRFPVLILWENGQVRTDDPAQMHLSEVGVDNSALHLAKSGNVLQLAWAENRVNWDCVERLRAGTGAIPGWVDTARDWFGLRADYATQIEQDDAGGSFLGVTKLTWLYSVPIQVRDGAGYLLAGRHKGDGCIGWQAMEMDEHVVVEEATCGSEASDGWTWQVAYMRSQAIWNTMRVLLSVKPYAGTVSFDDVVLIEIYEPEPTNEGS